MESRINKIEDDIKTIKENHLAHLEKDMAVVNTNIQWIMDNHKSNKTLIYAILASSIAGIIISLIKLL